MRYVLIDHDFLGTTDMLCFFNLVYAAYCLNDILILTSL